MAFASRFNNDPYATGYIVQTHKKCGKDNCRCATQGKLHIGYALKYREYVYGKIGSKQRSKYLAKKDVAATQAKLTAHKDEMLLWFHKNEDLKFYMAESKPTLRGKAWYPLAYQILGRSQNSQKWLKLA